jgi:hypothetical protein
LARREIVVIAGLTSPDFDQCKTTPQGMNEPYAVKSSNGGWCRKALADGL